MKVIGHFTRLISLGAAASLLVSCSKKPEPEDLSRPNFDDPKIRALIPPNNLDPDNNARIAHLLPQNFVPVDAKTIKELFGDLNPIRKVKPYFVAYRTSNIKIYPGVDPIDEIFVVCFDPKGSFYSHTPAQGLTEQGKKNLIDRMVSEMLTLQSYYYDWPKFMRQFNEAEAKAKRGQATSPTPAGRGR